MSLGQGGKLGHYPVHFHMARQVPTGTFIKDSVINESMTRWITVHSTQGVLLQRNIGWKSIGHGFFLENATETDNKFYSNLGIFARAAVANPQNPRMVPGIFSAGPNFVPVPPPPQKPTPITAYSPNAFPFASDILHPTVFWITNGCNDFVGNMAAGAGSCGAAYWFVPAQNSDMPDVPSATNQWFGTEMKWPSLTNTSPTASTATTSYAGLQNSIPNTGITPLKRFYGNYATSAMNSFQTVAQVTQCFGIDFPGQSENFGDDILGVKGFAPAPTIPTNGVSNMPANGTAYYPYVGGGSRIATLCPISPTTGLDCSSISGVPPSGPGGSVCSNPPNETNCAVTVLDHFTSSFHWAEQNFAAIWLRPNWFLVVNSVLTDVQTAGITFVSGGDYTRSSSITGGWKLIRDSIFAGYTQAPSNGYPANPYVSNASPFMNGLTGNLTCDNASGGIPPALSCINSAEGVSFPLSNFGTGQRLFNIYDGPAYQDSNIYLDIPTAACGNGQGPPNGTYCLYSLTPGVRLGSASSCYLPNAAIGWKQPNGFFYPPSFHSINLFFANVDIRHYVIDALFDYGSYIEDKTAVGQDYCSINGGPVSNTMFTSFTDIDRQTELSDDDGSLTGLINNYGATPSSTTGTVSVNPTSFFTAPVQTDQCLSDIGVTPSLACQSTPPPTPTTAITSPYEYVTMAVYSQCGVNGLQDPACGSFSVSSWGNQCSQPNCYGIPLYRQYLAGSKASSTGEWMYWNTTDSCSAGTTSTACRWPFVRMGGESSDQRSTMTANNGTYYLDTAVGADQQVSELFNANSPQPACSPASQTNCTYVNVFQPSQTYYVYFLYAKPDTTQTIQVYVGANFDPSTQLQGVRIYPAGWPLNKSNVTLMGAGKLPTGWIQNYSAGILTVTTNFSALTDIVASPANGLCLPSSFCTASDTSCGCTLASTDPLYNQCQQACSKWAVKDLDFPPDGAYGFAFTLPSGFQTAPYNPTALGPPNRPAPTSFPTTANPSGPDWTSLFLNTTVSPDSASGGQCYYPNLPSNSSSTCPVIYPNPTSN